MDPAARFSDMKAVLEALRLCPLPPSAVAAAGLEAIDVDDLVHGTTLVTNAIVEDRVEPVALIATQGFEEVLDQCERACAGLLAHVQERMR